ncbi:MULTISPECIES: hypothetical protein [unclassified Streptomyces]|uniref:hypothetical protein n=1 Tax=unclassified Streptomyces TaxID=2593676 RepID=UPI000DD68F58|nr:MULTISPECIES: hypothetical protein [unclassified Streptomyces]QZZ28246.1 hypothetical protein A7X85_19995 [Streptomyces sp. ST1015]
MKFDALYHANFALLSDAVTDWGTLVHSLEQLQKDAEDGLHKAANKANWAGVNSQVSREFIGKTAGEFADAHTQANSIYRILNDTLGELKGFHQQLTTAVEGARTKGFTVLPSGDGFMVTLTTRPQDPAGKEPDRTAEMTAVRDDIQKILNQASTSDSSAATVLKALVDQSELGFSGADYKDRDTAAAAVKEADDLARLAKKDPHDLTVKEFDQLNAGFQKYADDPLFAERFATTLGPQKTLEFWSGLTDGRNYDVVGERRDQLDDLQRGLSLTLAGASQSDSTAMNAWKNDMTGLGAKRIGSDSGPMGFQVMSNLMRVGDYDDKFLTSYGNRMMATEKELTGYGQQPNRFWQFGGAGGTIQRLNFLGDDTGADPLTGYMRALSNSPDAATAFFNEDYVTKDDPDNPFERDSDDENDYKGKVGLSNFQYLFEERDWPEETSLKGDDLHTGQNYMAMALEAATTGHPAGEMPTVDTPAHNSEQTRLFESIVSSIADSPDRLTDNGYMSDSVGQITSEYLPDINRAMTDDEDGDTDKLFPVSGASATLNHRDVTALLISVGQNPEGYAAVEVGNKAYMANLMDYHMNPDLSSGNRYSQDTQFAIEQIAHGSGEVSGTLAIGRQEAIAGPADEDDKAYEHSVAQWKNTASGAIGTGIGVGVSFIATPVGGAVAGGVAGSVSSLVLEELFQDAEGHAKDDAGAAMGEEWETGVDQNSAYTERAAELAAKAHNRTDLQDDSIDEKARAAAQQGFRAAGANSQFMTPHLKTDI